MKSTIRPRVSRLLLGLAGLGLGLGLAINAYGQPTGAPAPGAAPAPSATGFVIKFKVKPGKNATFEKAMNEVLVRMSRSEPRNVYCDLLHLALDSQTYVIVERFTDPEAARAHAESEYIKKLGATLANDLLDQPPEVLDLVFIRSK